MVILMKETSGMISNTLDCNTQRTGHLIERYRCGIDLFDERHSTETKQNPNNMEERLIDVAEATNFLTLKV